MGRIRLDENNPFPRSPSNQKETLSEGITRSKTALLPFQDKSLTICPCLAIFFMSAMIFFSCCSIFCLSRSRSRMARFRALWCCLSISSGVFFLPNNHSSGIVDGFLTLQTEVPSALYQVMAVVPLHVTRQCSPHNNHDRYSSFHAPNTFCSKSYLAQGRSTGCQPCTKITAPCVNKFTLGNWVQMCNRLVPTSALRGYAITNFKEKFENRPVQSLARIQKRWRETHQDSSVWYARITDGHRNAEQSQKRTSFNFLIPDPQWNPKFLIQTFRSNLLCGFFSLMFRMFWAFIWCLYIDVYRSIQSCQCDQMTHIKMYKNEESKKHLDLNWGINITIFCCPDRSTWTSR